MHYPCSCVLPNHFSNRPRRVPHDVHVSIGTRVHGILWYVYRPTQVYTILSGVSRTSSRKQLRSDSFSGQMPSSRPIGCQVSMRVLIISNGPRAPSYLGGCIPSIVVARSECAFIVSPSAPNFCGLLDVLSIYALPLKVHVPALTT